MSCTTCRSRSSSRPDDGRAAVPGTAHAIAAALDRARWPEVAGSIAGDDTVFIAFADRASLQRIRKRLLLSPRPCLTLRRGVATAVDCAAVTLLWRYWRVPVSGYRAARVGAGQCSRLRGTTPYGCVRAHVAGRPRHARDAYRNHALSRR